MTCGAVGTLTSRTLMPRNWHLLPDGTQLSEGQDLERQLDGSAPPVPIWWSGGLGSLTRWRHEASPPSGRLNWCFSPHPWHRPGPRSAELLPAPAPPRALQMILTHRWTLQGLPQRGGDCRTPLPMDRPAATCCSAKGDTYADRLFRVIERRDAVRPSPTHVSQAVIWAEDTRLGDALDPAGGWTNRSVPEALLVARAARRTDPGPTGRPRRGNGPGLPVVESGAARLHPKRKIGGRLKTLYQLCRNPACANACRRREAQSRPRIAGNPKPRPAGESCWAHLLLFRCCA